MRQFDYTEKRKKMQVVISMLDSDHKSEIVDSTPGTSTTTVQRTLTNLQKR